MLVAPPTRPAPSTAAATRPSWDAELRLTFARREARTVLAARHHRGPLAFQKALYPEGDEVCHGILIHPPAGIAGGDSLRIGIEVGEQGHALITTPGAGKWYRSTGPEGSQLVRLHVQANATLEWLPQEAIVFDAANARSHLHVVLAPGARYIGQEMICLGRTARGEFFTRGDFRQSLRIERAGRVLWREACHLKGNDPLLEASAGLAGAPVFGTLVCAHEALDAAVLDALREHAPAAGRGALTQLPGLLVARWMGPSAEPGRQWFTQLWQSLRPRLLGREAIIPRIWNT